jgi:hypothetical protein
MRNTRYFKIDRETGIAIIYKSGSSSIAKAVVDTYYPKLSNANFHFPPDGHGINRPGWQGICPKITDPRTSYAAIREPVDRFLSAFAQIGENDINKVLTRLENDDFYNPHLWKQSQGLKEKTKLYKFPHQLEEFADDTGLSYPLPEINDGDSHNPPKPELTQEQEDRVKEIYKEDILLYNYISVAGIEWTMEKPQIEEVFVPSHVTPRQLKRAMIKSGIELEMVDAAIASIPDTTQRALIYTDWNDALTVERNYPLIDQLANEIGLTTSQVDDLFILASNE